MQTTGCPLQVNGGVFANGVLNFRTVCSFLLNLCPTVYLGRECVPLNDKWCDFRTAINIE